MMGWLPEDTNMMRLAIIVALAAMPLVGTAHAQTASHYQIVSVPVPGIFESQEVFLLDTQTGDTWTLAPEAASDGKATGHKAWYIIERHATLPPLIQPAPNKQGDNPRLVA